MSQRNAKLVRKFVGRQAAHRVYVHKRSLVERMERLSFRDRTKVRARLARRDGNPIVPLSGGKVLDLRSHAMLVPEAPRTKAIKSVTERARRAARWVSRWLKPKEERA